MPVTRIRRRELIDVALGSAPADRVIAGGQIVNVLTGEISPGDIAIKGDRIAYVGDVSHTIGADTDMVDATGHYVAPGFIETHLHGYSTHLGMTEYANLILTHGTTVIADGFYAYGSVAGVRGVRAALDEANDTHVKVVFLQPSLSFLQNRQVGLPSTPNALTDQELWDILDWPECRGLEEPPFPVIVEKDPLWLEMFEEALERRMVIMGHGTSVQERALAAYLAMGAAADHSGANDADALMKLRMGCRLNVRQGAAARNLVSVVKARSESGLSSRGLSFCSDELDLTRIVRDGHIDHAVRLAIAEGVPPIEALQMATINAADLLRITDDSGLLAPGRYADAVIFEDLEAVRINAVLADGVIVADHYRPVDPSPRPKYPDWYYGTVELERPLQADDFRIGSAAEPGDRVVARCLGITDGTVVSTEVEKELVAIDGDLPTDPDQDVMKVAMVDRFGRGHQVGVGLITGFTLARGAIGTTYSPQTQNIVMVGATNEDLAVAGNAIARMGGGFVVVDDGEVVAQLETPLLGLMHDGELDDAIQKMDAVYAAVAGLGYRLASNPFHMLAFQGPCSDIRHLKIAPGGMFDMVARTYVDTVIRITKEKQ